MNKHDLTIVGCVLLLISCNSQNDISSALNLEEKFSIKVPETALSRYYVYDSHKKLFAGYNYSRHSFDLFDLKDRSFIKSIELEKEGPNAVRFIKNVHVTDKMSLSVEGLENFYQMDTTGKVHFRLGKRDFRNSLADKYRLETPIVISNINDFNITHGSRFVFKPLFVQGAAVEGIKSFFYYDLKDSVMHKLTGSGDFVSPGLYGQNNFVFAAQGSGVVALMVSHDPTSVLLLNSETFARERIMKLEGMEDLKRNVLKLDKEALQNPKLLKSHLANSARVFSLTYWEHTDQYLITVKDRTNSGDIFDYSKNQVILFDQHFDVIGKQPLTEEEIPYPMVFNQKILFLNKPVHEDWLHFSQYTKLRMNK